MAFAGVTWLAEAFGFGFGLATECFGVAGAVFVAGGGLDCTGAGGGELTTGAGAGEELEELWVLTPVVAGLGFDCVC